MGGTWLSARPLTGAPGHSPGLPFAHIEQHSRASIHVQGLRALQLYKVQYFEDVAVQSPSCHETASHQLFTLWLAESFPVYTLNVIFIACARIAPLAQQAKRSQPFPDISVIRGLQPGFVIILLVA